MPCAICRIRKEQRFCPAVHGRICAICCGTEREVTLDCPSECPYLQQARKNEKPRDLNDDDRAALSPEVTIDRNFPFEREPLILGLSFGLARVARADRAIRDRDVIAALTAMIESYKRLVNSGLHYEETTPNLAHQALMNELRTLIKQYRELEEKHVGYSALKDSDVLQALVFLLRTAFVRTNGRPRSRAFLDLLFTQFPETSQNVVAPGESGSRIVMP